MSVLQFVTVHRPSWAWPLEKEVVIMRDQHFAIQLEDYSLPAILPFPYRPLWDEDLAKGFYKLFEKIYR